MDYVSHYSEAPALKEKYLELEHWILLLFLLFFSPQPYWAYRLVFCHHCSECYGGNQQDWDQGPCFLRAFAVGTIRYIKSQNTSKEVMQTIRRCWVKCPEHAEATVSTCWVWAGKGTRGRWEGGGWTGVKGGEQHRQKPGNGQEPGSSGTGKKLNFARAKRTCQIGKSLSRALGAAALTVCPRGSPGPEADSERGQLG